MLVIHLSLCLVWENARQQVWRLHLIYTSVIDCIVFLNCIMLDSSLHSPGTE